MMCVHISFVELHREMNMSQASRCAKRLLAPIYGIDQINKDT